MIEPKNNLKGLVRLFIADGLPPNIKVLRIGVHEGPERTLVLDRHPWMDAKPTLDKISVSDVQEEHIELQELTVDGYRVLAGFSQLGYTLIIGVFDDER